MIGFTINSVEKNLNMKAPDFDFPSDKESQTSILAATMSDQVTDKARILESSPDSFYPTVWSARKESKETTIMTGTGNSHCCLSLPKNRRRKKERRKLWWLKFPSKGIHANQKP